MMTDLSFSSWVASSPAPAPSQLLLLHQVLELNTMYEYGQERQEKGRRVRRSRPRKRDTGRRSTWESGARRWAGAEAAAYLGLPLQVLPGRHDDDGSEN